MPLVWKWEASRVLYYGARALGGKSPMLATTEAEFQAVEKEFQVPF